MTELHGADKDAADLTSKHARWFVLTAMHPGHKRQELSMVLAGDGLILTMEYGSEMVKSPQRNVGLEMFVNNGNSRSSF